MKTLYLVFIALWAAIQIALTPVFLRAQVNGPTRKSLATKMICATAFVAIGALSAAYAGSVGSFAAFMLIGLALSWFGDLFLHVLSDKKIWFVIGFCFFLSAHVFYIINYVRTLRALRPDAPVISIVEIAVVVAALLVTGVVYVKVWHMKLKSAVTPALALYGIALAFMAVKAVGFCAASFPGRAIFPSRTSRIMMSAILGSNWVPLHRSSSPRTKFTSSPWQ